MIPLTNINIHAHSNELGMENNTANFTLTTAKMFEYILGLFGEMIHYENYSIIV